MSGELHRYEKSNDLLTARLWEEVAEKCWKPKETRPKMSEVIESMSQINAPITGLISVFHSDKASNFSVSSQSPRSVLEYTYNIQSHQLSYLCYNYSPLT